MYELMGTKKEDDEFVLQITHSLLSLLECQATRSVLLESTQVSLVQPHNMLICRMNVMGIPGDLTASLVDKSANPDSQRSSLHASFRK